MPDLITASEARRQGLPTYFTGLPCKNGHLALRYIANRTCAQCLADEQSKRDHAKQYKRKKEYQDQYRIDNASTRRKNQRLYGLGRKQQKAGYDRQYREKNKEKRMASHLRRVAAKRSQTPDLSDVEKLELQLIYEESSFLGPKWHVDHIVPLSLGGLHHPDNVQIVSRKYNIAKNARLYQDRKYI